MSSYKCGICGHLNSLCYGTNPPKRLESMPCHACSFKFSKEHKTNASVRTDLIYNSFICYHRIYKNISKK